MVLTEAERTSPKVFASPENIKDFLTALKTKDKDSKGPPIINLPEAEEFSFKSGQAVLSQAFSQRLRTDILQKILTNLKEYDADIIEVIGHTDEVAVGNKKEKTSTLDTNVINFILGQNTRTPTAIDNAGLGLARASAVTRVLRTLPELKNYEILPYSAGQLVLPDETLTTGESVLADDERRRIEIRVRRRMRN
jgi:flagellar motor protein MotB